MRGPKPLPRNVVELRGNPGKRPLNPDEPQPELVLDLPEPPRKLKREARREWDRVVPRLIATRVLAVQELSILATYCNLHAEIVKAEKTGDLLAAAYYSHYRSLAAEFGLTPSSRTRIKTVHAEKDDEAKRFFS